MSDGRYNIPKQYKVDKGMPLNTLFDKIDNEKCRRIFGAEIESVEWSYHIVSKNGITNMAELVRENGLSLFEVKLKRKVAPELLTEVLAGLIKKPAVIVYLCARELAMGVYLPPGENGTGKMCSTDFYQYDPERMINIIDYEADRDKSPEQIGTRIFALIRNQRRMIMIEKAYERLNRDSTDEMLTFEFSIENLDKIRADAEFVQSQLMIV